PDSVETKQSFLLHPVTRRALAPVFETAWSYRKLARAFAKGTEEPYSQRWEEIRSRFVSEDARPLPGWWQAFAELCEVFRPAALALKGQLDTAAAETLFTFLETQIRGMEQASSAWPALQAGHLGFDAFINYLQSQCATLAVRTTGDPFNGLQVLSIEE